MDIPLPRTYLIPISPHAAVNMALAGNVAYFSVPDIIMFLSKKNQAQSKQIWLEKNKELKLNCIEFKFPYVSYQLVVPLPDALRLVASISCEAKRRDHLTAILNQHRDPADKEIPIAETPEGVPTAPDEFKEMIVFDEIVPDATVRHVMINDTQYLSVRDLIMCLCGQNSYQACRIWKHFPDSETEKLTESLRTFTFPGPGQLNQSVITFPGALRLIALLPGKNATINRSAVAKILRRNFKGDPSLMEDAIVDKKPSAVFDPNKETSLIPFDDIVPGATVRLCVIDGIQYLSARDVIMHVCGKKNDEAGLVWRRMPDSQKAELKAFQFPGRGQQVQPVITFPGALKLIMFLPGEKAKKHRSAMVKILTRYFAGDASMIKEIEENALSEAQVPQLARASLASDEIETLQEIDEIRKRKRDDTELLERNVNIASTLATTMKLFDPRWNEDVHLRAQAKSAMASILKNLCDVLV